MADENFLRKAGRGTGYGLGAVFGFAAAVVRGGYDALNGGSFSDNFEKTLEKCAEQGGDIGADLAPGAALLAVTIMAGGQNSGGQSNRKP